MTAPDYTDEPIKADMSRRECPERRADGVYYTDQLFTEACSHRKAVSRTEFDAAPQDEQVRDIGKQILPDSICPHAPPPVSAAVRGAANVSAHYAALAVSGWRGAFLFHGS